LIIGLDTEFSKIIIIIIIINSIKIIIIVVVVVVVVVVEMCLKKSWHVSMGSWHDFGCVSGRLSLEKLWQRGKMGWQRVTMPWGLTIYKVSFFMFCFFRVESLWSGFS
jgi:hypothetical protein